MFFLYLCVGLMELGFLLLCFVLIVIIILLFFKSWEVFLLIWVGEFGVLVEEFLFILLCGILMIKWWLYWLLGVGVNLNKVGVVFCLSLNIKWNVFFLGGDEVWIFDKMLFLVILTGNLVWEVFCLRLIIKCLGELRVK